MFVESKEFQIYTQNQIRFFHKNLHSMAIAVVTGILMFSVQNLQAQELRINPNVTVMSDINSPFAGIGIGLEGPMGKHFAAVIDANIGFGETGALMVFKPAVHFYFTKGQTGFFIGPVVSYMKLKEKNNEDIYVDNIYGGGFSIGVKSRLSNRASFNIMLSPQLAVGAGNAEGGTATLQVGFGYKL